MPKAKKTQSESNKLFLTVDERKVFGKKLNRLRKEGMIPANIYGSDFKSKSISVKFKDFISTFKVAKETGVIYLKVGSEELPTLIKNVQKHPVNNSILHVDFRKINLKQKILTNVPVKVIGQSEAVSQKGGVLLTLSESLLVEALPTDFPKEIEVDITQIKEIGQEIKVSDLKKSDKYELKDHAGKVIISVVAHKEESITPETAPVEAPEVITAAPSEEGTVPAEEAVKPTSTKATEGKQVVAKPESPKPPSGKK